MEADCNLISSAGVYVCVSTHIYVDTIWSPASTEPQRQPLCIDANRLKTNLLQVTTGGCMRACVCMCVQKKDNIKEDIVCAVEGESEGKGKRLQPFSPHLEIMSCRHFTGVCFQSLQEREKCPLGNSSQTSCLSLIVFMYVCVCEREKASKRENRDF